MNKNVIRILFLLSLLVPVGASAQQVVPASRAQVQLSYAPVVKAVASAVVNIYTRKVIQQRVFSPLLDDPFFRHFFGENMPQGMTRKRLESSLGSGVIIRPDGLIVTCNHVIAGADQITVVLSDRREFEAAIVTADDRSDLAVLRIEAKGEILPYVELKDSDSIEVGDLVLALGNPFGVGQTVTSGIVSAMARTSLDINDLNYFIQTDAAINPGNSGGALVTMDGKLVGINSAIYSRDGGNMGIGFAVPSNMVRTVIGAVDKGQKNVTRPWVGFDGQSVTSEVAASLGLQTPAGVLVNAVHTESPARAAGLKIGDVIVAVNGKPVEDPAAFRYRVATMAVGTDATLEGRRKGEKFSLSLKLIAPPEKPLREETQLAGNGPLKGLTIVNLSPAVSEEYGFRGSEKGVAILKVSGSSVAARYGFQKGDVLLRVNNAEINSVKDAVAASQARAHSWRIFVKRGDEVLSVTVGGFAP